MLFEWPILLGCILLLFLCAYLSIVVRRRRDCRSRDDLRRLELLLQPGETIKQICPQRSGRCILTSKRLIFDSPSGIHAVPLRSIKQLQGFTEVGKKTTVPTKMAKMIVYVKQEYIIENTGSEFVHIAKVLLNKAKKRKQKNSGKNVISRK